jgi:hypothetical protein
VSARFEKWMYVLSMNASPGASPHSRPATYAPGTTNRAIRSKSSGRSSRHQRIFGPWEYVGGQPESSVTRSAASCMRTMYGAQRVSSQESKYVAGSNRSSIDPMPDIWPEKATPATSPTRPERSSAVRIVRCAEASISPRSCSTCPGAGERRGISSKSSPRIRPSSSTTAAFVPIVPRSQPTKTGIA